MQNEIDKKRADLKINGQNWNMYYDGKHLLLFMCCAWLPSHDDSVELSVCRAPCALCALCTVHVLDLYGIFGISDCSCPMWQLVNRCELSLTQTDPDADTDTDVYCSLCTKYRTQIVKMKKKCCHIHSQIPFLVTYGVPRCQTTIYVDGSFFFLKMKKTKTKACKCAMKMTKKRVHLWRLKFE